MPDITCIINCCNHEAFIAEALKSVLTQELDGWSQEVIVVDDGSADNTIAIVEEFVNKSEAVQLIKSPQLGQSGAINLALAQSRGRYIMFCDGDDYLHPHRAKLLCEEFERSPDVALILNARKVFGPSLEVEEVLPELHNTRLSADSVEEILRCTYGTSRTAVRAAAIEKILPLPEVAPIGADFAFMELLWLGTMSALPKHLTYYRVHQENLFHTSDPARQRARAIATRNNVEALKARAKTHPSYEERIAKRYFAYFEMLEAETVYGARRAEGTATRADKLAYERAKIKLYWPRWTTTSRCYQYLRYLAFMLLPLSFLEALRLRWQQKKPSAFHSET